ncbi:fibronectin type III domain-containing protein [Brevibacterium aurantiacum]|uniref:Purple acid phosphatase N-terminal domain-containing protein n=1 Tax=Brevibacterium aurantiacum TaxID=273384 RepID=A0A2A3ZPB8_BREAU|nr:fibronectin type III domain-containing protein [Brevibacterium aurantiacum]AZT92626.1 hypothetical protein CXR23_05260 [Brevibacterium aurantiacum]PCC53510.1 hypothetical protein CIK59_12455 [Brevibacterium aurantiacum]
MKTQHHLIRPLGFLSALTLLAALVSAPIPAHAQEETLGSDPTVKSQERTPAITDPVLQIGADERTRNLSWMSESAGGGEVRWAKASELEGRDLPTDAKRATTSKFGLSTDLKRHYNQASMIGLEQDTEYVYQVGSEEDGFSSVAQFDTGTANSLSSATRRSVPLAATPTMRPAGTGRSPRR